MVPVCGAGAVLGDVGGNDVCNNPRICLDSVVGVGNLLVIDIDPDGSSVGSQFATAV